MDIESKIWNYSSTGTKLHAFINGVAVCRSSIRRPGAEHTALDYCEAKGHPVCGSCDTKFNAAVERAEASMEPSTGEGDYLPPAVDANAPEAPEWGCCDHAPMYHGARGCDECGCTAPRTRKPKVLDLFCCQGGAGQGYADAGFDVTGVDLDPQPRYPFRFFQADAVAYAEAWGSLYSFVHASPPCQHDSDCQRIQGRDHADLIGPTRDALNATGLPWVIENVRGAVGKLWNPVMLCGAMFGLKTYRHRFFEAGGGFTFAAPEHPVHTAPQAKMGRPVRAGEFGQYIGNFSGVEAARQDLGVPWMNRDGIRECIPPVYTAYIGGEFRKWSEQQ